ncbi:MAG: IS110 family transposase [Luteolibacter sp.]
MKDTYYIGLDAHKDTIAIAHALGSSRANAVYHGSCGGSLSATENALRKLAKKLGVEFKALKVCYEAGPTGFVLARRLIQLGLECVVMAPTKSTRKPNEKIKTDKRDAMKIAREFRNGDITEVRIPPSEDQAIRDVVRARTDASDDL